MSVVDEYVTQRFKSKYTGKEETDRPYTIRQTWFNNNFPTFKELADICKSTERTIKNYSVEFQWMKIKQKSIDLQAQADREEDNAHKKETIDSLRKTNSKRAKRFEKRLDSLEEKLETCASQEEEQRIWEEIIEIDKRLSKLQEDRLRDAKLPKVINDKQDHHLEGEVQVSTRLKRILSKERLDGRYNK